MNQLIHILTSDWGKLWPQPYSNVLLAIVAALCGALVGMERERKDKPTGIRTLTLVSLGAAVFTMLSEDGRMFDGRIVAQIVSGVGFLGAGAIIHRGVNVGGLTSAATIWVTAALGTAAGFGYGGAALGIAIFVLGVLTLTTLMEDVFLGRCRFRGLRVRFAANGGKTAAIIEGVLSEYPTQGQKFEATDYDPDLIDLKLQYCEHHKLHREILVRLAELPDVLEIEKAIQLMPDVQASHPNSSAQRN